jgi:hypothetical protein
MAIFDANLMNSIGMNNNSAMARPQQMVPTLVTTVSYAKQSTKGKQQSAIEVGTTPFADVVQWSLDMSQNDARLAEHGGIKAFLTLI